MVSSKGMDAYKLDELSKLIYPMEKQVTSSNPEI